MSKAVPRTRSESNSRTIKRAIVSLRKMSQEDRIDLLVKARLLSSKKARSAKNKLAK